MISFKGHYDGKAIVPDEPVSIPAGRQFNVSLAERQEPEEQPPKKEYTVEEELEAILSIAADMGPPDLSQNFRRYFGREVPDE